MMLIVMSILKLTLVKSLVTVATTTAFAVALALIVIELADATALTVVPIGMQVPSMGEPTLT